MIKDAEKVDYSKPKLVMGYLTPKILARALALPQEQLWQLLGTMQEHLISRDIQFYFSDAAQQQLTRDLGWAGELRNSSKDFLAINRANLGGGKTDGVIEEVDSHDVRIASDGTITDTLTIIRKHNGVRNARFIHDRNVVYIRAYVPLGSTFVNATGFEAIDVKRFKMPSSDRTPDPDVVRLEAGAIIDDTSGTRISTEAGHTVFGNWLSAGVGEVTKATITYTLPFTLNVGGSGLRPIPTASSRRCKPDPRGFLVHSPHSRRVADLLARQHRKRLRAGRRRLPYERHHARPVLRLGVQGEVEVLRILLSY